MFAIQSDKLAKKLIQSEYRNAVETYGEKYESIDLAEDVLSEEISEADEEIENIYMAFSVMDFSNPTKLKMSVSKMRKAVINGIKELAQVGAVLNKIEKSGFSK